MGNDELLEVVRKEVSVVVGEPAEKIEPTADLRDIYDVDSLEIMEIGTRLEERLDIRLELELLEKMRTCVDAVEMLAERIA